MSFSVGIVGLPNVGKSTLFKALTKIKADIAPYPFTTIHPNVGVVHVPDERLTKIAEIIKPEKVTPTIIEFVDIAGLVKDAHKGEGLGNQFLAQIRNCDAIVEAVRGFSASAEGYGGPAVAPTSRSEGGEDQKLQYQLWEPPDPERDVETIKIELLMKDLENLEGLLSKIEKEVKSKDKMAMKKAVLFEKIKYFISRGKLISELELTDEEKLEIKEYQFLTQKPVLYLLNTDGGKGLNPKIPHLEMNLKDEVDFSEFSQAEALELGLKSQLDQLILGCYNILDLITFFTVAGGKETRAWTLKRGLRAPNAGGVVHSDFQEKFIKAEVIPWQQLAKAGNWKEARELGWLKIVGHEYQVQDGDVIEFRI